MLVTPPPTPPRRDRPGRSDRKEERTTSDDSSLAAVPKLLLGPYFGASRDQSDAGGDDWMSSIGSGNGRSPGTGAAGVHEQHHGRKHGYEPEATRELAAWMERAMRAEAAAAAAAATTTTAPVVKGGGNQVGERDTRVRQIVLGFLRETEEEEREAIEGGGGRKEGGRRREVSSTRKGGGAGGGGGSNAGGGLLARLQAKGRQLALMRYSLEDEQERNVELIKKVEDMAKVLEAKEFALAHSREDAGVEASRARADAEAAAAEVVRVREEAERVKKEAEEVRREAREELLGERGRRSLVEIECEKLREEVASLSEGRRGERGEVDALDLELDQAVRMIESLSRSNQDLQSRFEMSDEDNKEKSQRLSEAFQANSLLRARLVELSGELDAVKEDGSGHMRVSPVKREIAAAKAAEVEAVNLRLREQVAELMAGNGMEEMRASLRRYELDAKMQYEIAKDMRDQLEAEIERRGHAEREGERARREASEARHEVASMRNRLKELEKDFSRRDRGGGDGEGGVMGDAAEEAEASRLTQARERHHQELEGLRRELSRAEAKYDEETRNLRGELAEAEAKRRAAQEEAMSLNVELCEKRREVSESGEHLRSENQEILRLEESEVELTRSRKELEGWERGRKGWDKEREVFEAELGALTSAKRGLEASVQGLEKKLQMEEARREDIEAELSRETADGREAREGMMRLERLSEEVMGLRSAVVVLGGAEGGGLAGWELELRSCVLMIEEMAKEEEKGGARDELCEGQSLDERREKETERQKEREKEREREMERERERSEWVSEISTLKARVQELRSDLEAAGESLAAAGRIPTSNQELNERHAVVASLEEKLGDANRQLEERHAIMASLEEKLGDANRQLEERHAIMASLEEKLGSVNRQLEDRRAAGQSWEREKGVLKNVCAQHQKEIKRLEQACRRGEKERMRLQKRVASLEKEPADSHNRSTEMASPSSPASPPVLEALRRSPSGSFGRRGVVMSEFGVPAKEASEPPSPRHEQEAFASPSPQHVASASPSPQHEMIASPSPRVDFAASPSPHESMPRFLPGHGEAGGSRERDAASVMPLASSLPPVGRVNRARAVTPDRASKGDEADRKGTPSPNSQIAGGGGGGGGGGLGLSRTPLQVLSPSSSSPPVDRVQTSLSPDIDNGRPEDEGSSHGHALATSLSAHNLANIPRMGSSSASTPDMEIRRAASLR